MNDEEELLTIRNTGAIAQISNDIYSISRELSMTKDLQEMFVQNAKHANHTIKVEINGKMFYVNSTEIESLKELSSICIKILMKRYLNKKELLDQKAEKLTKL